MPVAPYRTGVDYLARVSEWLLDLFLPVRCLGCARFGRSYLCGPCLNTIPVRGSFECVGCKRQVPRGETCFYCRKENQTDHLLIASRYDDRLLQSALKTYKYRFIPAMSAPLSVLLRKYLKGLSSKGIVVFQNNPVIIPVPLSRRRENWRGFNQAALLARNIADGYQMAYAEPLGRTDAEPQAVIEDRPSRLANMHAVISWKGGPDLAGRPVILVDDICTTGATLNACTSVLKEHGAGTVTGLVVARG